MASSKMNARERIDYLFDDHSFVEVGGYVTARNTDYNLGAKKEEGDGVITGYGIINDRVVYVYSQDAKILGGSVGEMHARKIVSLYDLAMKTGAPVIGMIDCAGLRLQEATDALHAFGTIFNAQVKASGMIPQISAVFGMCGGGSAVMSALSDFTFIEKGNGSLFVNSPNTLDNNEEAHNNTAGALFQSEKAGNVDFVCDSEEEVLDGVRMLVDVLPSNYSAKDTCFECDDDLNRVIPEYNEEEYDAVSLLKAISDDHIYLEPKSMYAKDMVTVLIRLNGETVGAVANQETEGQAVLTKNGLEKAERFVKFCDAFSIPLLTVTNVRGIKANVHEERKIAGQLAKFTATIARATVPRVNLIVKDAFGTAAVVMNSKAVGADFVLAWPQARIGMMDAEQAVRIMYAEEISGSTDQISFIQEKAQEYEESQSSALAAAKRGYVDDIIEPDATRKRLIAAFEMLYTKKGSVPEKKHPAI